MVIGCACQRGAGLGDTGIQRSQIAQRRVEAASRSRSARKRSVVVISGLLWHHRNYIRHFRSIKLSTGTSLKLNDYLSRSSRMAKALAIFGAADHHTDGHRIFRERSHGESHAGCVEHPGAMVGALSASLRFRILSGHRQHWLRVQRESPADAEHCLLSGIPMLFGAAARILPITLPFSSVFVSNLCAAAAMLLLFALVARLWDEDTAIFTIFTVAAVSLFPASFFLSAGYAESTALLFTVAAFAFLFRGRIALAAVCAGCLSGIRPLGFLLSIPLIYATWRSAGSRSSLRFLGYAAAAGATAVSGLIGFVLYCWIKFHDPLVFVHARAAWKGEGGGLPPSHAAWQQLTAAVGLHYLATFSDPWFFLMFAAIAIALWKRLPMKLNLIRLPRFWRFWPHACSRTRASYR
jgi:hypothetical protein